MFEVCCLLIVLWVVIQASQDYMTEKKLQKDLRHFALNATPAMLSSFDSDVKNTVEFASLFYKMEDELISQGYNKAEAERMTRDHFHSLISESKEAARTERYVSKQVREIVWDRDQGRCTECGSNEKLEFDHIIPYSKGGSNSEKNIQLLCQECNRKKSDNIGH